MSGAIGIGAIGSFVIGGGGTTQGGNIYTANLIRLALLNSGAVSLQQTIFAEEMYTALDMLSGLLAQWQRRRWLVWSLTDTSCISGGQQSYMIGPNGDFNVPRPDKIESAFARLLTSTSQQFTGLTSNGGVVMLPPGSTLPTDPTGLPPGTYWNNGGVLMVTPGDPATSSTLFIDYPLAIITAREDYNEISLKQLTTFPAAVFYDSAYPTGNLYFWPIPQASQWELHVTTKTALSAPIALSTMLVLPPEYQQAMMYTLACMVRPAYGLPPDPTLLGQARAAVNTVRVANAQVAELDLPAAVLPIGARGGVAAGSSQGFQSGWTI